MKKTVKQMKDIYTNLVMTVIAVCLSALVVTSTGKYFIEDAQASSCNEERIVNLILHCVDGSRIWDGRLSTYCKYY